MKILLIVISLLFYAGRVFAAPDGVTKKLLEDRPSMMDFGLYRLNEYCEKFIAKGEAGIFTGLVFNVEYNYDTDKIICELWMASNPYRAKYKIDDIKSEIERIVTQSIKTIGDKLIDGDFFAHSGYTESNYKLTDEEKINFAKKLIFNVDICLVPPPESKKDMLIFRDIALAEVEKVEKESFFHGKYIRKLNSTI